MEVKCHKCLKYIPKDEASYIFTLDVWLCFKCASAQLPTPRESTSHFTYEDIYTLQRSMEGEVTEPAPLTLLGILEYLNKYVVGQDTAKRILSQAAYVHNIRANSKDTFKLLKRSNILLMGSSGSGKTLLVDTLSKILNVPLITADASLMTSSGYVGNDASDALRDLIQIAGGQTEAEYGIIFIDEIDKLAHAGAGNSLDVSGTAVQQELLKMIEGSQMNVDGYRKMSVSMNTKNILFIFGGAFSGLGDIIVKRLKSTESAIGFTSLLEKTNTDNLLQHATTEDLVEYGLLPELLGRIPIITALNDITEEVLCDILTVPDDALVKEYQELFMSEGCALTFTDDALKAIAKEAIARKVGARGLRSIVEQVIREPFINVVTEHLYEVVLSSEDVKSSCKK